MSFPSLYHYTNNPVDFQLYHAAQSTEGYVIKPNGIWVTPLVEDNWEEWCRSEHFNLNKLRYRIRMVLKPTANILWIKNVDQLDRFTEKYRKPLAEMRAYDSIDWLAVTADYQGLLITPYLWERRLDPSSFWYYGWDCASGCFWSPNVWESVEPDRSYRGDTGQKQIA